MEVIFWCEFPHQVDWKEAKKLIKFKTEIYVAVKNRKEYEKWKKKIKNKNIDVGAWPVLDKEKGYWFSGFVENEEIEKLKQFDGIKIKVDIEPPFPGGRLTVTSIIRYCLIYTLRKGKNNEHLRRIVKEHKGKAIISGFPLPNWVTRRYGDVTELSQNMEKNFISYTTLNPLLLPRWYIRLFAKRAIKRYGKKAIFAIGCTGKGVFGNEKTYKNIEQFKRDLQMMKQLGARKIVVFNLEGIMQREDKKHWIEEINKFICE
ncbi:MAG: hypothetical protein QW404_01245 [Candidatus Nanoarchaeia archaeon]